MESRRATAARSSPPVISLPEEEHLNDRRDDSPDGSTASIRDGSESSAPGPNDTTVQLSGDSGDEQEVEEGQGKRGGGKTRWLPGGRIVPGSCRTRRRRQFCWICRKDIPNALAEAHFSRHRTASGHSTCPVCDIAFRRDRTSMNRHVRGHYLPYRHRCHRCGSMSQTRVRLFSYNYLITFLTHSVSCRAVSKSTTSRCTTVSPRPGTSRRLF